MTTPLTGHPVALLEDFSCHEPGHSFCFTGLEDVLTTNDPGQVAGLLDAVEQAAGDGYHAVGFVSYEAASGLNPEYTAAEPSGLPLIWFALYRERLACLPGSIMASAPYAFTAPVIDTDRAAYCRAIDTIRQAIARGESYQVNHTIRQRFTVTGDPFALYRHMCRNQQAAYCAWLDTGTHRILSASPELFFALKNGRITMKPMKGTAPRLPIGGADQRQQELLSKSVKDRAENLMIVDMIRNDLSIIAETGSVHTPRLFDVETFPTVHQMTSTVTARLRPEVGLTGIFRALFPCGSVTGAPKRRTMEIIRALESSPRGVYCGAIGHVSPGGEAVFSVAIRTAVVEAATGRGELGIGSGITWDSDAENEYQECLTKSAFLDRDSRPFRLIESLRHDEEGFLLLQRHLERLAGSAEYFGFRFDEHLARTRLHQLAKGLSGVNKVRLLLDRDGGLTLDAQPIARRPEQGPLPLLAFSSQRVAANDPFRYHKTTHRELYEQELAVHPGRYDVIFLNTDNEVTEGCFNTVVISRNGELLTPRLQCGLLPGVLRQELLDAGIIRETTLIADDLRRAEHIWLVNSVRGWRECNLQESVCNA